jgi:hypothetical protein
MNKLEEVEDGRGAIRLSQLLNKSTIRGQGAYLIYDSVYLEICGIWIGTPFAQCIPSTYSDAILVFLLPYPSC